MTRHSKNNNDRAFFTYHERLAAKKGYASSAFYKHANGAYGGGELLVGADSLRDFDACCLSLHPCRDPVITPQGYLYEREAIYEYILQKRKDNERALEAFAAYETAKGAALDRSRHDADARAVESFERSELGLGWASAGGAGASGSEVAQLRGAKSLARGGVINDDASKHAKDMNFWAPQNAPSAEERPSRPDTTIRCPMSGEPLRLKQLVAVHFTPAEDEDDAAGGKPRPSRGGGGGSGSGSGSGSGAGARTLDGTQVGERYVCPLTQKGLTNAARCVVLRPSGQVVSAESLAQIIRRDMLDPFCVPPAKLSEADLIPIRTEGTGFALRGSIEVKKKGAMVLY